MPKGSYFDELTDKNIEVVGANQTTDQGKSVAFQLCVNAFLLTLQS